MNELSDLSYQLYSEFKTSDWYIYWDKDHAYTKKNQLLVVWHVSSDNYVYYDYTNLKSLLASNTAQNGLPYMGNLSETSIEYFLSICQEFIADVDYEIE